MMSNSEAEAAHVTGVVVVSATSTAERERLTRVLRDAGYMTRLAAGEDDLREAAQDSGVHLIVIEATTDEPEIAHIVNRIYDEYGSTAPPIMFITVRDPKGPVWTGLVVHRPVYFFPVVYADEELRIIVRMLIEEYSRLKLIGR